MGPLQNECSSLVFAATASVLSNRSRRHTMTQFGLQRMKEKKKEREKEGNFCEAYLTFIHGRTDDGRGRTHAAVGRGLGNPHSARRRLRLESLPRCALERFRHFWRNRAICGRPSAWRCKKETSAADGTTGNLIPFWENL